MEKAENVTRDKHPCDRCGKVTDVLDDLPGGALLCLECFGIFTCLCCRRRFSECVGAREEYSGDPEKYVCDRCEVECQYDAEIPECTHHPLVEGECRCWNMPGPVPRACPKCGACNHINLPPLYQLEEGDIVTCGDCEQQIIVGILAFVSISETGLGT